MLFAIGRRQLESGLACPLGLRMFTCITFLAKASFSTRTRAATDSAIAHTKQKTHGDELEVSLDPYWNQFFDALILQDQDPSYLWALREKVFVEKRPLYVNYDRSPCGPS